MTQTTPARRRRCQSLGAASAVAASMSLSPTALASMQDVRPRPRPEEPVAAPPAPAPPRVGPRRQGVQVELLAGATACMPADGACGVGGTGLEGVTLPSFGMGLNVGWRPSPYFIVGGAYRFGMFHPGSDVAGFEFAHQNALYAVVRPIWPVRRVDLGVDLGLGYSNLRFEGGGDNREYSQGFSLIIGPTVDIFLTDRFFIGAKVDFLLNAHYRVCTVSDGSTRCAAAGPGDIAPVHQVIYGLHFGGTFGG